MIVKRQLHDIVAVFFVCQNIHRKRGFIMAYTPYNPYQNPYYPYPQMQQQNNMVQTQMSLPQPQQNNQGLIWVSGEVGAKSYLVAPNTTVMLMDSEQSVFYIKSTDGAGMPTIRAYEYKERTETHENTRERLEQKDLSEQYVTRDEYKSLIEKYEELSKELKSATQNSNRNSNNDSNQKRKEVNNE